MGYIKHHAIVLTTWEDIAPIVLKAKELGLDVLGPSFSKVNGYATICIPPDGSKEGWTESDEHDAACYKFKTWLLRSVSYEWVDVAYGSDDATATVIDSAWQHIREDEDTG
jgi:hypothetical protein